MKDTPESYTDDKGRIRWPENDALAAKLKELGEFLIVAGYEESHAARYGRLAYSISRHPEPVSQLHAQGRLQSLDGVGPTVAGIIGEYLTSGTCKKFQEFEQYAPASVLEVSAIPGLGIRTVKELYHKHGIDSLRSLKRAMRDRTLEQAGVPRKALNTIEQYLKTDG